MVYPWRVPARGRAIILSIKRMKKAKVANHELLVNQQRVTLLELLDRLLDKGVVAKGEIILSVAEIDLVYLNLGLLLSSVKTVEKARGIGGTEADRDFFKEDNPNIQWVGSPKPNGEMTSLPAGKAGIIPRTNGIPVGSRLGIDIDPKNVEKGLAKLVLTLIELLRKLMEKQAIRRMEAGFLAAAEVERMGIAFQRLEEKMADLKQGFALKDEDLNLDLGPLGELI